MEVEEKEPKSEENAGLERLSEIIDEDMKHMVEDDPDIAVEELKWVAKMKRMMEEPSEEDEILQTKVISSREVARSWKSWLAAIDAEVQSLLEGKKEALKKITRKQSWAEWWQAQNPLGDMRELRIQKGFKPTLLQRRSSGCPSGQQPDINGLEQSSTSRLLFSTLLWIRATKRPS